MFYSQFSDSHSFNKINIYIRNMKWYFFLFVLAFAYACKPRYDFAKVRSEIKTEMQSDSIVYQTAFEAGDSTWYKGKKAAHRTSYLVDHACLLSVEAVNRLVEDKSPCGPQSADYAVSAKVKLTVGDSTNLGYAGICFDRINDKYYRMLMISTKGTFYLKDVCNGEETLLIPNIPSRYLNKGSAADNAIEIRHRKREVRILFNGNLAAICKINRSFSYGETALIASTTENNIRYSPVKAAFASFVLKKMR